MGYIHAKDLPENTRDKDIYKNKLILKEPLTKENWKVRWGRNVKKFKSIQNKSDKTISISQKIMERYIQIEIQKLINASELPGERKELISILVLDKKVPKYDIEWVLLVHIIHKRSIIKRSI